MCLCGGGGGGGEGGAFVFPLQFFEKRLGVIRNYCARPSEQKGLTELKMHGAEVFSIFSILQCRNSYDTLKK